MTNVVGSVDGPGVQAGDGVAAWLVGPAGLLQVVVMNVVGSVDGGPTVHDATGVVVLFAGGWLQVMMK